MRSRLLRRLATALPAAALLALPAPARAQAFRADVVVLQLNDVYRIDAVENGRAGGLGRVATLIERTRRSGPAPVMVFHAGDFLAPSLESRYFAGRQMVAAMNFLHARAPLLAVPGNHEFDERRPEMLAGAITASRFPWLADNVRLRTGDAAADARLGRDTVLTVNGLRLGVFTLTFLDAPRGYAEVDTATVARAERQIAALEARGVDAIVGLTHLALETDRAIAALRARHPKLLWIAGGHEHFLIREGGTDDVALITKGDSNARRIWRVAIGREGGRPAVRADSVVVDASVPVDPRYAAEVERAWADSLRRRIPFFDQPIGLAATVLDGREESVRNAETNWGGWLAERARGAFLGVPADVGVVNGGAIRIDDAFSDTIRFEHLARTFGFPTRIGLVWLRGGDLRETLLERSVSGGRGEGRFLQVSGVRFRFSRARPVGDRVCPDVQVQRPDGSWAALEEERVYTVAVPDYLLGGGDGYGFHNRAVMSLPPGPDLKLLAFDELTARLSRGEAIAPRADGRIAELPARADGGDPCAAP